MLFSEIFKDFHATVYGSKYAEGCHWTKTNVVCLKIHYKYLVSCGGRRQCHLRNDHELFFNDNDGNRIAKNFLMSSKYAID